MTLVLAMLLGRGVVVVADTRVSGYGVYGEERKVYPVTYVEGEEEYGLAIVFGGGLTSTLPFVLRKIVKKLNIMIFRKNKYGEAKWPRTVCFKTFKGTVRWFDDRPDT